MTSAYVAGLLPQIRSILESSDLTTISAKGVRKQLISLGHEEDTIKENRKDIDAQIAEIYEELTAAAPSPPSSEDLPLTASSSRPAPMPQSSLPEPLQKAKVKREEKPKPNVVETDAEMAARLQAEFDALHGRARPSRASASVPARKKTKSKVKKRASAAVVGSDDEDGEERPKKRRGGGGGAFNKELLLSDSLAEFIGEPRVSRPQVVKRIWDYVKLHDLQDPSDKRWIRCDPALRSVFHTDRVHMFTMNKLLAAHFMDPDDVIVKEVKGE
ncbi:SWIB/MDM2 domain-containing protein [Naematelia encephala]|uniref:SWIB/MDM2 domain-containing protein n=1 Tax=Naematelia encephala TaxID=71784 RepID=A0A1Y2B9C2_9TREE|nr:SWIB/MDM2 domain-containing protein [Naematelia encephala]